MVLAAAPGFNFGVILAKDGVHVAMVGTNGLEVAGLGALIGLERATGLIGSLEPHAGTTRGMDVARLGVVAVGALQDAGEVPPALRLG